MVHRRFYQVVFGIHTDSCAKYLLTYHTNSEVPVTTEINSLEKSIRDRQALDYN